MTLLSTKDVAALFADPAWAAKIPPIVTVDQAAQLAQVPKGALYLWSSQGRLRCCSFRAGKHLRILRDKFIQHISSEKFNET